MYKNLIHIGLPKTATSFLQRNIFPVIPRLRDGIIFNDIRLLPNISNVSKVNISSDEIKKFKEIFSKSNHLVSNEMLINWNPHQWEDMADRNLELFGRNSTILITIKNHREYLTSVYQQTIQNGNIKKPSDFFINKDQYNVLKPLLSSNRLTHFDVDSFDLSRLKYIYEDRFEKVIFVSPENLFKLDYLRSTYSLTENEIDEIKSSFKNANPINRSYSNIAMNLTFLREKILNTMGVMTIGSEINNPIRLLNKIEYSQKDLSKFNDLVFSDKIRQLPRRIKNNLAKRWWRILMQGAINKYLPYNKYKLPDDVYINEKLESINNRFVGNY